MAAPAEEFDALMQKGQEVAQREDETSARVVVKTHLRYKHDLTDRLAQTLADAIFEKDRDTYVQVLDTIDEGEVELAQAVGEAQDYVEQHEQDTPEKRVVCEPYTFSLFDDGEIQVQCHERTVDVDPEIEEELRELFRLTDEDHVWVEKKREIADKIAKQDDEWVRYEGPQGGQGWQNTRTGEVVYQDEKPGTGGTAEPGGGLTDREEQIWTDINTFLEENAGRYESLDELVEEARQEFSELGELDVREAAEFYWDKPSGYRSPEEIESDIADLEEQGLGDTEEYEDLLDELEDARAAEEGEEPFDIEQLHEDLEEQGWRELTEQVESWAEDAGLGDVDPETGAEMVQDEFPEIGRQEAREIAENFGASVLSEEGEATLEEMEGQPYPGSTEEIQQDIAGLVDDYQRGALDEDTFVTIIEEALEEGDLSPDQARNAMSDAGIEDHPFDVKSCGCSDGCSCQHTKLRTLNKGDGDDDRFVIYGPASVEIRDYEGDRITGPALQEALPQLLRRARFSLQHLDILVGEIHKQYETEDGELYKTEVRPVTKEDIEEFDNLKESGVEPGDEALFVVGSIFRDSDYCDDVIAQIEDGSLSAFSISGQAKSESRKQECDGFECKWVNVIDNMELSSVTICEEGINPAAQLKVLDKAMVDQVEKSESVLMKGEVFDKLRELEKEMRPDHPLVRELDKIAKETPPRTGDQPGTTIESEEPQQPLGYTQYPQGPTVDVAPSDDAATTPPPDPEDDPNDPAGNPEYPAGSDRGQDSVNEESDRGDQPRGFYQRSLSDRIKDFLEKQDEEWIQYEGPQGGQGWQNVNTGEIVYQEEKPGSADGGEGGGDDGDEGGRVVDADFGELVDTARELGHGHQEATEGANYVSMISDDQEALEDLASMSPEEYAEAVYSPEAFAGADGPEDLIPGIEAAQDLLGEYGFGEPTEELAVTDVTDVEDEPDPYATEDPFDPYGLGQEEFTEGVEREFGSDIWNWEPEDVAERLYDYDMFVDESRSREENIQDLTDMAAYVQPESQPEPGGEEAGGGDPVDQLVQDLPDPGLMDEARAEVGSFGEAMDRAEEIVPVDVVEDSLRDMGVQDHQMDRAVDEFYDDLAMDIYESGPGEEQKSLSKAIEEMLSKNEDHPALEDVLGDDELEKINKTGEHGDKMRSCKQSVMGQGHDEDSAANICADSIFGKNKFKDCPIHEDEECPEDCPMDDLIEKPAAPEGPPTESHTGAAEHVSTEAVGKMHTPTMRKYIDYFRNEGVTSKGRDACDVLLDRHQDKVRKQVEEECWRHKLVLATGQVKFRDEYQHKCPTCYNHIMKEYDDPDAYFDVVSKALVTGRIEGRFSKRLSLHDYKRLEQEFPLFRDVLTEEMINQEQVIQ